MHSFKKITILNLTLIAFFNKCKISYIMELWHVVELNLVMQDYNSSGPIQSCLFTLLLNLIPLLF